MPRNGAGSFTRTVDYTTDRDNGIRIDATRHDGEMDDVAAEITNSLPRDGQAAPTANIPFGGFKITGYGTGSAPNARTDVPIVSQVQDGSFVTGTVGGTADAITLTPTPAITAYTTLGKFRFKASGDNTTTATLAISGLAAKTIKKLFNGALSNLEAGDIESSSIVEVVYESVADAFMLMSPRGLHRVSLINVQTFTASGTFTTTIGTNKLVVLCVGGGGGGGAALDTAAGQLSAAGGGGGGAHAMKTIASPAASYAVAIGALGAGSSTTTGGTGGDTTFGVTVVVAKGGLGGTVGLATTGAQSVGGVGGSAAASTGDIKISGQQGGFGVVMAGANFSGFGGDGGDSTHGIGGRSLACGSGGAMGDAVGYGAGGPGAINAVSSIGDATGGNGTAGICIVMEYV